MRANDPDRVEVTDDVRNLNDPLLDYMYQVGTSQRMKGLRRRLSIRPLGATTIRVPVGGRVTAGCKTRRKLALVFAHLDQKAKVCLSLLTALAT